MQYRPFGADPGDEPREGTESPMTVLALAELLAGAVVLQPPVDDEDALELLVMLVAGFLFGLYLIYDGFDTWQLARLMEDTPTAKVRSMAVGRTEVEGVVRKNESTLQPPYTDEECVYVSWEAEERERYTDDDGNTRYRWETVADGTEAVSFFLEDETGKVLVRADTGAEFDIFDSANETSATYGRGESPPSSVTSFIRRTRQRRDADDPAEADDDSLFDSAVDFVTDVMESNDPLGDTSKRRRYEQTVLPVGSDVYVFGSAEPREGAHMQERQEELLEIRRDGGTGEFLVADASEDRIESRYSRWGPAKTVGGLLLSTVTLFLLLRWYYAPFA